MVSVAIDRQSKEYTHAHSREHLQASDHPMLIVFPIGLWIFRWPAI